MINIRKSFIGLIFLFLSISVTIYFSSETANTVYYNVIYGAFISIFFMFLVIVVPNRFFWKIIAIISFFRNTYYFWMVAYSLSNGIFLEFSLPYIFPNVESFSKAGILMIIEVATLLILFIIDSLCINVRNTFKPNTELNKYKVSKYHISLLVGLLIIMISIPGKFTDWLKYSLFIILFIETSLYIDNLKVEERIKLIMVILFFLFVIVSNSTKNRKRILYFGISSFFFMRRLFPKYKNIIKWISITMSILIISFLTALRFNNKTLLQSFTTIDTFSSYMLTIEKVATGVETKDFITNNLVLQLFIDFLRPIIGVGYFLKKIGLEPSPLFYNQRTSYGGLTRTDQIIPFNAQVSFVSPVLMVLFICIIIFILIKLDSLTVKNVESIFFIYYITVVLSFFQITNLTIISNTISYTLFPSLFYFLMKYKIRN